MTNKNYWANEAQKDKVFTAINQVKTKRLKESLKEAQRCADYPRIVDLATKHNKVKIACLAKEVIIAK